MAQTVVKPQRGPQEKFMSSDADIIIYGGAAGGGKTFAILMEPLRHIRNKNFGAVILRKNAVQITVEGGLWDESFEVYGGIKGAVPRKSPKLQWVFKSGARVSFQHQERDEELFKWQGAQIALLEFDELTHFTEKAFFYLQSRCRTTCGVKPYVRATCNPDADSWVANFISWWIDKETGYPIQERSGIVRYFIRHSEKIEWGDSREELYEKFDLRTDKERVGVKSCTFIASNIEDNQILLEKDPAYMANLKSLALIDRERLLKGNWKIKPAAGLYFKRSQIGAFLESIPDDVVTWCRCWDLAATESGENGSEPAATAGVLMGKRRNGRYLIADVVNVRLAAADVRKTIYNTCVMDRSRYGYVVTRLPQDPGQAGKEQAESYMKYLSGFPVVVKQETGSKETRAEPWAAQWQFGMFDLMLGPWNDPFVSQLESFPESKFKDMVDAGANAFSEIESGIFNLDSLI
jgi:predicted phage terminase large subunit-like protein